MPGFGSVGVWEVILILAVLLLVFGAKRLPEIGAALGKGIREFKGSVREIESEFNRPGDRPSDRPRADLPRNEAPRTEEPAQPREVETTRPEPEKKSDAG
ncbi:MAG: twin-arginine translocase TatA/TatE family subunit [Gemmatimonadetes bacterium]|nr:twin-arginine translocase TatA/TatE family subunit [Gemmatimonadota bacterium]NIQ60044.1 twin-arginine translocase TatA/TatE family subunit [Gemmatimonadota bacterium]NIU80262.1 twin-arginine translocase TatA/TatE family subunit [Gammaproteobacteria bacterium]NIX48644.1 twin-arginine translocase TatA/TatE family subunit [Gemmatimonadota bacterium]NIY13085.1 twin-arginine translocase TatA/TatE family subunit [Gemmatimonadota bacterium]